jgi:hypothetical protein
VLCVGAWTSVSSVMPWASVHTDQGDSDVGSGWRKQSVEFAGFSQTLHDLHGIMRGCKHCSGVILIEPRMDPLHGA